MNFFLRTSLFFRQDLLSARTITWAKLMKQHHQKDAKMSSFAEYIFENALFFTTFYNPVGFVFQRQKKIRTLAFFAINIYTSEARSSKREVPEN